MTCYSHSRVSCFEQCRYKYKLQYIDKVKVDVPTTVEAFMGDLVHRTLEKLYNELKFEHRPTRQDLIDFYIGLWSREWTDDILIVKQQYSQKNYRRMGERYISDYYDRFKPFDDMQILGLETQDRMKLPDGNQWHVRIDKLGCKGTTYYVCDYKTNSRMKDQSEADSDTQLAMYSVWVKNRFADAAQVILMWHMLAFKKDVVSKRTDTQLKQLQDEICAKINEIESCTKYPTQVSPLCDYCVYKSMCPSFMHNAEIEEKPAEGFKEDEGVRLVDELSELESEEKKIKQQKEDIRSRLISFAEHKSVDTVFGSNKKASIKPYMKFAYPDDKEGFIDLLKQKGIYDSVSMVSYPKLGSMIKNSKVPREVAEKISTEKAYRISLSKKG